MKKIALLALMFIGTLYAVACAQTIGAGGDLVNRDLVEFGPRFTRPFVVVVAGQSNAEGQSNEGAHTVGANIWITNSKSAPATLIPAAYGTAPLNSAPGGTTTDPNTAYNNAGVAFANALRDSGLISAGRPIIIVPDWEGSKSISNWTRAVGYDAYTTVDMWARLEDQLAVVTAAYPNAIIDHVMWLQGENDSGGSSSFNTRDLYYSEFTTQLIPKFQALPTWSTGTTMSVSELGTWANNTGGQARNDAIRMLRDGLAFNFLTTVSAAGLSETSIVANLGPHFDGNSLNILGQRHFAAWRIGRERQQFQQLATSYGSGMAYPNLISVAGAGRSISPDEIRTGAVITLNGGTVTLPNTANIPPTRVILNCASQTRLAALGTMTVANVGTSSGVTLKAGDLYEAFTYSGTAWYLRKINASNQGQGNSGRYVGGQAFTGSKNFASYQLAGTAYTLNGATATLTPIYGSDVMFFGGASASTISLSSGSFTFTDGSTASSLTLQSGQWAWIISGISGTTTLTHYVVGWSPSQSRGTQRSVPTSGGTVTSTSNVGHLTSVIEPAGTLATLTIVLPANPVDGQKVTYATTQTLTAVTWSGGTLGISKSGFSAGERVTFTYLASQSKWY